MTESGVLRSISRILSSIVSHRTREPKTGCVDCPIVMRCGLEPQQQCLGRIEAIARGDRRQAATWDTGLTGHIL